MSDSKIFKDAKGFADAVRAAVMKDQQKQASKNAELLTHKFSFPGRADEICEIIPEFNRGTEEIELKRVLYMKKTLPGDTLKKPKDEAILDMKAVFLSGLLELRSLVDDLIKGLTKQ